MAHRSSNVSRGRWVVSQLDLSPSDRVLEIGFGPGIAIDALSRRVPTGQVYGVDHSATMVRTAGRRNRRAIRAGRVQLMEGSADALPPTGSPLDWVVAVNSMGFWPEQHRCLQELRARLRPGGRIAIASQPRCRGATAETSRRAGEQIEHLLRAAGYTVGGRATLPLDPPVVCVIAVAGPPGDHPPPRP